jgi:hypothetical protein
MRPATLLIALSLTAPACAETFDALLETPALDRWMYPFNATPGTRPTLSVFGSDREVPTQFDARDGQVLVAFDTAGVVPAGGSSQGYVVRSAEVTLQVANKLVFRLDTSPDAWTSFLPTTDARFTPDVDAGQPVELFGVGFRNGWTPTNFVEAAPFTQGGASFLAPGVRNAFAAEVDALGATRDVSNNPREGFQAAPFAVGTVTGLAPGSLVPLDAVMRFEIDVDDPGVQAYLREGLDRGRVHFAVSALTIVERQGGDFPVFYARENALVALGFAQAPRLRLVVDTPPACRPADLDCNGLVDTGDVAIALLEFGPCAGCPSDVDATGTVDFGDIAFIMLDFG